MRRFTRVAKLAAALTVAFSSILSIAFSGQAFASGVTRYWCGPLNGSFNSAANWKTASDCTGTAGLPATGDSLVFNATNLTAGSTVNNDMTGLSVANITFSGTNSSFYDYMLSGNSLTLTGDLTVSASALAGEIQNPLILNGNPTITVPADQYLSLQGVISGTGNIGKAGLGALSLEAANTYTGSFTASAGSVDVSNAAAFGNAANAATFADGADLQVQAEDCETGFTVPNALTLVGVSSDTASAYPRAKLGVGGACAGGGSDEEYGGFSNASENFTLSGDITLSSDATFAAGAKTTTLTGALIGAHKFTLLNYASGQLVINSSSNVSGMANGTYTADTAVQTLSDDQSAHSVAIYDNAVITIDGKRGDTLVRSGGTLKGTGTVGLLSIYAGGTVAPGHSPGCMNTGNLTENGTYQVEIGGTDACTGYDQLKVTGTVDVTGGTLSLSRYNNFKDFKAGQKFTIIDNDGTDAVTGTFSGLAEGATVKLDNGTVLGVSYVGGTGNDVVLSVKNVPTTPDTGLALVSAHPLTTLALSVLAAGAIVGLAQRSRAQASRR